MATPTSLILQGKPPFWQRVDVLLLLQRWASGLTAIAGLIAAGVLVSNDEGALAVSVVTVGLGAALVGYGAAYSRQLTITEYAQTTLRGMQAQWNLLREDEHLLRLFGSPGRPAEDLPPEDRLRIRFFLAGFLDEMSLVIHHIRLGYFRDPDYFATVYENVLSNLLDYNYVQLAWLNDDDLWGPGKLRDELGRTVSSLVDSLVKGSSEIPVGTPSDVVKSI